MLCLYWKKMQNHLKINEVLQKKTTFQYGEWASERITYDFEKWILIFIYFSLDSKSQLCSNNNNTKFERKYEEKKTVREHKKLRYYILKGGYFYLVLVIMSKQQQQQQKAEKKMYNLAFWNHLPIINLKHECVCIEFQA